MTDKKWAIIEKGHMPQERYSCEEIKKLRSKIDKKGILIHSDFEPIYVIDEGGFEKISIAAKNIRPRASHNKSSVNHETTGIEEIFSNQHLYYLVCTQDLQSQTDKFITTQNEKYRKQPANFINKKMISIKEKTIRIIGTFFTLSFCFSLSTKLSLEGDEGKDTNVTTQELHAKSAPKSLSLYEDLIAAKLEQNAEKYAKALLDIEKSREHFSKAQLPSPSFSLAIAISTLQNIILDENDEKNLVAYSLSKGAKSGLPLIASETAKLERWLKNLLSNKTPYMLQPKDIQWLSTALTRIASAFNNIPIAEKIFQNRMTARASWAILFGLWQSDKENTIQEISTLLPLLKTIIEKVPTPDRNILEQTLLELDIFLSDSNPNLLEIVKSRVSNIDSLQNSTHFLCNPQEGTIVNEYLLQTLSLIETTKSKKFDFSPILKNCFVGHRRFLPPVPPFYLNTRSTPISFYIPTTADLKPWFNYYKNVLIQDTASNPSAKLDESAALVWKNQVGWPTGNKIPQKNMEKLCSNLATTNHILCANMQWSLLSNATERAAFLNKFKEILPQDVSHNLALSAIADLFTTQNNLNTSKISNDNLDNIYNDFAQYLKVNGPEYDTVIWYYQNHGLILK